MGFPLLQAGGFRYSDSSKNNNNRKQILGLEVNSLCNVYQKLSLLEDHTFCEWMHPEVKEVKCEEFPPCTRSKHAVIQVQPCLHTRLCWHDLLFLLHCSFYRKWDCCLRFYPCGQLSNLHALNPHVKTLISPKIRFEFSPNKDGLRRQLALNGNRRNNCLLHCYLPALALTT